jgi:hypothetical protein
MELLIHIHTLFYVMMDKRYTASKFITLEAHRNKILNDIANKNGQKNLYLMHI